MTNKNQLWTIGSILKWTEQYFKDKGVESARLDAEVLLSHILRKERIYLYVHFDEPLQQEELSLYREFIKQRVRRLPVAYIIGYREFMGYRFEVTPDVLIPRPDTEILVEAVCERLKDKPSPFFADVGAGSGAIVVSLLKLLPRARARAVDISPSALTVARRNAAALAVEDRVDFSRGDLLTPLTGGRFDAIVSNPPYIPARDIASLQPEVRQEPLLALKGGDDGLDCYRRLLSGAAELLTEGGFLAVEIGIGQSDSLQKIAADCAVWSAGQVLRDYGNIERVLIFEKQGRDL